MDLTFWVLDLTYIARPASCPIFAGVVRGVERATCRGGSRFFDIVDFRPRVSLLFGGVRIVLRGYALGHCMGANTRVKGLENIGERGNSATFFGGNRWANSVAWSEACDGRV